LKSQPKTKQNLLQNVKGLEAALKSQCSAWIQLDW
jgi:hypothetical protein